MKLSHVLLAFFGGTGAAHGFVASPRPNRSPRFITRMDAASATPASGYDKAVALGALKATRKMSMLNLRLLTRIRLRGASFLSSFVIICDYSTLTIHPSTPLFHAHISDLARFKIPPSKRYFSAS